MRPCIGCGYCCQKGPCSYSNQQDPLVSWKGCPDLTWDGERWWCGVLLKATGEQRESIIRGLDIGNECCCPLHF